MARIGQLIQYNGPFLQNEIIEFDNKPCKIGISIDEKDYMFQSDINNFNFNLAVEINGKRINIGRTFMYQPGDILKNVNIGTIKFVTNAPKSTKVNILYTLQ